MGSSTPSCSDSIDSSSLIKASIITETPIYTKDIWPVKDAKGFIAPVFSNNMVLQRNVPCIIWGNIMEQTSIKVKVDGNGNTIEVDATIKGNTWKAILPPKEAGGPYIITITGNKQSTTLENVVFGEVWVASGQSNMIVAANGINGKTDTIDYLKTKIGNDNVRFCNTNNFNMSPWSVVTDGNLYNYSCIAEIFACELYYELKIPIGIVQIAEGNTYAQSWMSNDALSSDPDLALYLNTSLPNNKLIDVSKCYDLYISKVLPMSMRGVIWYQGENNANVSDTSNAYLKIMTALIKDWRSKWGQGDFPFLLVQLPKYQTSQIDAWCGVREAQILVQSTVPVTGTAVTIDKGNINPNATLLIHPTDKKEIGIRLGLLAKKIAYGKDIIANSPIYKNIEIKGNKITVTFENFGSALKTPYDTLTEFEICGSDMNYTTASAKLVSNDSVEIWSDNITSPIAVRYCFKSNPQKPSLFNSEGLPASPFRSDNK